MISRFKITPVRLPNGIIVNEILLKKILTKLKKCKYVELSSDQSTIYFRYETPISKGTFTLHDISNHITDIDIPSSDLLNGYLEVGP